MAELVSGHTFHVTCLPWNFLFSILKFRNQQPPAYISGKGFHVMVL